VVAASSTVDKSHEIVLAPAPVSPVRSHRLLLSEAVNRWKNSLVGLVFTGRGDLLFIVPMAIVSPRFPPGRGDSLRATFHAELPDRQ
jgi:hypothetical protein